jgi:hypothetical protein
MRATALMFRKAGNIDRRDSERAPIGVEAKNGNGQNANA